ENLLEAIRKEYWHPDEATLLEIAVAYAQSVVQHGHREPGEANEKLEFFLTRTLLAPGPESEIGKSTKALLEQYRQKTAEEMTVASSAPTPEKVAQEEKREISPMPKTETVEGEKMEEVQPASDEIQIWLLLALVVATILLFLIGFRKRIGGIS
ncbi:MAG: hypothetical protein N2234_10940, partial [Planctomycetota bacterium]|nr:hypothetical protein [Planctomycetota bacterium]